MNAKKVGVAIVTYNNVYSTLLAIESVLHSDYRNIELLVVDNGSNELCEKQLRNELDERGYRVEILCMNERYGYGAACNRAAQYLLARDAELLLFLNNDVILNKQCILRLSFHFEEERTKAVGPKIYRGFSDIICSTGGFFNKASLVVTNRGNGEKDKGQYDKTENVEFVNGCAFLVSAKYFIELGGFDEKFYYYSEETDLCYRIIKEGGSIIYEPQAIVYHWTSTTFGDDSKKTLYYLTRSALYFVKKHTGSNRVFVRHLAYILYNFIIKLTYCRVGAIITRYIAVIRGIRDFFRGKTGTGPYL
ncbi:MAG: glycosyltransferase family 2 protein [Candidatus Omnitrophota bacterium]